MAEYIIRRDELFGFNHARNAHDKKRTFARAAFHIFNLSAARDTLVAVRFAVWAAYRFILLRANTSPYPMKWVPMLPYAQ